MRLPAALLPERIVPIPLAGSNARGVVPAEPLPPRAAHVEKTERLTVVDQRPESATRGQEIAVSVYAIVQVEHMQQPGELFDWDGDRFQIVAAERHRHPLAPQHCELWAV